MDPPPSDADYPEELVGIVAAAEQKHFWFGARNNVILSTIRRVIGPLPGTSLLDIGCGTGFVLFQLLIGMERPLLGMSWVRGGSLVAVAQRLD